MLTDMNWDTACFRAAMLQVALYLATIGTQPVPGSNRVILLA
jgi:hypothetical protein